MSELRAAAKEVYATGVWFCGRVVQGNGRLLESPSGWFDVPTLGALTVRIVAPVAGLAFYGAVLQRAPQLIYAVPLAWLAAVLRLSDSSATPPPLSETPSGDVYADESVEIDRVERGAGEGLTIIYPVRREVNGP
ncbi:hypothetical protein ACFWIB_04375 [Streptomyces sp. NPDC127051]|uniref:hypothetical protein n=1 Tax=Streptomyces sp. NPDC127051 TaxID=3347119 RepID=UPI00364E2BAA